MTGFLDRLAAHAKGTAPALRLRPRSRFEREPSAMPEPDEVAVHRRVEGDMPPRVASAPRGDPPSASEVVVDDPPTAAGIAEPVAVRRDVPENRQPAVSGTRRATAPAVPAATATTHVASRVRAEPAPGVPDRGQAEPPPGVPDRAQVEPPPDVPDRDQAEPPPTVPDHDHDHNHAESPPAVPDRDLAGPTIRDRAEPAAAGRDWPPPAEVERELTRTLTEAGLLTPEPPGNQPPAVRWPREELPEQPVPDASDVHLHIHLDRVEVLHPPPPPAPARAGRPPSTVDHDAYLARRREDRR